MKNKPIGAIALSLVLIAAGLVVLLTGAGPKLAGGATAIDYTPLFLSILAVAVLSFVFGAARYSLPGGIALAGTALHDQLLTLALTALAGIVVPQSYLMPVLVAASAVFTYALSLPVLRKTLELRASGSTRQLTHEQAAKQAVADTRALRLRTLLLGLLLLVAAAVGGGVKLAAWLLPVLFGLLAACWGATQVVATLWTHAMYHRAARKADR